jgi:hypothetical protein
VDRKEPSVRESWRTKSRQEDPATQINGVIQSCTSIFLSFKLSPCRAEMRNRLFHFKKGSSR